ncbi:hypothetical protein Pmani_019698 [Petrolisthes manimaculis]|uniref:Uncharacterized protein n=1 Tax=Petrolisthes manimaculis TaxID=1843537 RepID=A0AAE1PHL6_9EUCA|nr:hypothetical protein Pmani_019698 [Petrolisthes manimaculis]
MSDMSCHQVHHPIKRYPSTHKFHLRIPPTGTTGTGGGWEGVAGDGRYHHKLGNICRIPLSDLCSSLMDGLRRKCI